MLERKGINIPKVLIYFALIVVCVYNLVPFLWMLSSSLKTEAEVKTYPATILPHVVTLEPYANILVWGGFITYFMNSTIISLSTALISSFLGALAGYGFSRYMFKGRTLLMTFFLASQLLPGVLLVGPYFKMLTLIGLYDTRIGLIIAQTTITLPFSVWMSKSFVDTVPVEIDQAAMVDGASRLQTFFRVVLPLITPGIVATAIFAFLLAWGDLLWALCLLSSPSLKTVTLGITELVGQFRIRWSELMGASIIAALPPVILYLLLQRFLVKGFTAGAVKE